MGVSAHECVVCAWRAACLLKFKYEGSSSLHCPEFTRDISFGGDSHDDSSESGPLQHRNILPETEKPNPEKKSESQ